jgi:quercetin dioxygenase-like cupin family protein
MTENNMIAIDAAAQPWEERVSALLSGSHFRKVLLQHPQAGVEIRLLRYPAGFTMSWHTHSVAHGMYVLEGTLVTHAGTYGPGSFVWFPKGMIMQHGASKTEDVVMLFINEGKFDIQFVKAPEAEG